jgi:hypothetical protein
VCEVECGCWVLVWGRGMAGVSIVGAKRSADGVTQTVRCHCVLAMLSDVTFIPSLFASFLLSYWSDHFFSLPLSTTCRGAIVSLPPALAANLPRPILSPLYAAGNAFSKCHAMDKVRYNQKRDFSCADGVRILLVCGVDVTVKFLLEWYVLPLFRCRRIPICR